MTTKPVSEPREPEAEREEGASGRHGSLHPHHGVAALPHPPQPPEAQQGPAIPSRSGAEHGLRRGRQEQEEEPRVQPARGRGHGALHRPLPRPPRRGRRDRCCCSRRVRARDHPLRPRLLRPRRRHRRRGRQRPAHQGALPGHAGGRHGVRQQLRPREAADDHGRRGGGYQGLGPLHRRRRRDPAHASRWEAEPEAAAGAGVRGEGRRVPGLGADVLRHPAQLHAPLRRRVRRQGILLIHRSCQ